MENISAYIKSIRLKRGLTQAKIAALIGVRRYVVSDWETGRSTPRAKTLLAIQGLELPHPEKLSKKETGAA